MTSDGEAPEQIAVNEALEEASLRLLQAEGYDLSVQLGADTLFWRAVKAGAGYAAPSAVGLLGLVTLGEIRGDAWRVKAGGDIQGELWLEWERRATKRAVEGARRGSGEQDDE